MYGEGGDPRGRDRRAAGRPPTGSYSNEDGGKDCEESHRCTRDRSLDGERCRQRRGCEADQEVGECRHLRPASGSEVVGPLGDAGPAGARGGVQEGEGLVCDHQRRRQRPEAEDAGRPVPRERREGRDSGVARQGLLDRDRGGCEVAGREGDRVRPPGDRRHRRDLHLLRRQGSRCPAGQGCRRRAQEERDVQQEAGRRRAERRPDRQQLVPVQGRL